MKTEQFSSFHQSDQTDLACLYAVYSYLWLSKYWALVLMETVTPKKHMNDIEEVMSSA